MKDTIVYIGSFFLPDKSAGAQRALSLSKSFRDLGYNVILVGMEERKNYDIEKSKILCEGFEAYSVPKPNSIRQWVHHTISISEYKLLIEKIGIYRIKAIVTMEYEAIALWKLERYCSKHGIALIADAEEWYEHSRLPFPMNIGKDVDTFLRMRYVYPFRINNMISISRFFEKHYQQKIANIVYVPGTIDPAQDKWNKLGEYRTNKIFTISYAGHPGLEFEKERLDLLIRAVNELNTEGKYCCLKIAGLNKTFIEERLSDVDLSENIHFLGMIPHVECLKMIHDSDFSAIVREKKRVTSAGFPTKFSESFGCGTPVIATDSSNLAEYIVDYKNGIMCKCCSTEAIKQSIIEAMSIETDVLIKMHQSVVNDNPLVFSKFNIALSAFLDNILAGR